MKSSWTLIWGCSLEIQGYFRDLYSNCNLNLLVSCVTKACRFAGFNSSTTDYINLPIKCLMIHSYFKEPIFKTMKGFSMGDSFVAHGSKIILRIFELKFLSNLSKRSLAPCVPRYLRFCDSVSLHIVGLFDTILHCVNTISTGYPDCMVFNMESRVIYGKFLNFRIYNNPTSSTPLT